LSTAPRISIVPILGSMRLSAKSSTPWLG
jgi:hypothetical protein